MKALLDTNFLLIPGRFRVDVFSELEGFGKPGLYTIDLVVKELGMLAEGRGSDAGHARLGLSLLEKKGVTVLETRGEHADKELVRLASSRGYAVCTQDRELQKALKEKGVKVISLRQGARLETL